MKFYTLSISQKSILKETGFQIEALACFEHWHKIEVNFKNASLLHISFIFHITGKNHSKKPVDHNN